MSKLTRVLGIGFILAVGLPIAAAAGIGWYLRRRSVDPFNQNFWGQ